MKKINWKSNKTIAVILILAIVLLALLTTGIVFAVKHRRAESLPTAVPGTTAESLITEPAETETATGSGEPTAAATTAVSATAADAPTTANNGSSDKSSKPAGGSSGTNSKPSGTVSGSNTKPSGGSGGTNATPSGGSGGSGSNTSGGSGVKPVTTTKPAKKEFAMTKQEIIDYASDYIEDTYYDGFGKNVPGTGFNAPAEYTTSNSAEYIKKCIREDADATYLPNGWYKVYVEMEDEDTMRVYLFY